MSGVLWGLAEFCGGGQSSVGWVECFVVGGVLWGWAEHCGCGKSTVGWTEFYGGGRSTVGVAGVLWG